MNAWRLATDVGTSMDSYEIDQTEGMFNPWNT